MRFQFLRFILPFIGIFALSGIVKAQYFSVGNDPSSLKWKKISTDRISLIYPDYYEKRAINLVSSASAIIPHASSSLFVEPYKITSVVHPETTISNGWTMWVPRKVELSPFPSIYPMAESYTDHLLIHEIRHIAQLDKLDKGFTKFLGWILGDQASASVQALHVADWISEGDAVLTETLLSNSGRGRSPDFSMGLRTLLLGGQNYRYDKMRFGSYRDYVPDHYVLGYHMVAMTRILDQENFWAEMMDQVAIKPWRISNFNRFLHQRTGLWQRGLYNKTAGYMNAYWENNYIETGLSQFIPSVADTSDYADYLKAFPETDSTWICLKKSYSDIPYLVRVFRSGNEEKIVYTGSIMGDSFSYSEGIAAWAQHISDPRWEMRSFSDIFIYNIDRGSRIRLSKNQRYLYPVLNSSADKIAVLEEEKTGTCRMLVLSFGGLVEDSVSAGPGLSFRQPVWDKDDKGIYALLSGRSGKKLIYWELGKTTFEIVYDFKFKEISQLFRHHNTLFFTAPSGISQGIYSIDTENKSIYRVLSGKKDYSYPAAGKNGIGLSYFTPQGFRIGNLVENKSVWTKVQAAGDLAEPIVDSIKRTDLEYPVDFAITDTNYIISDYKKYDNLFNFHSWAPVFLDPDNYMLKPGAMVMSQNDLNSLVSSFGVQHNKQHQGLDVFAELNYTGAYPEIGFNIQGGRRKADSLLLTNDTLRAVEYKDIASSATIRLPLFYSKGSYYQRIQPYFYLTHHHTFDGRSDSLPAGPENSFELSYATATLGLAGQVLRRMSRRDLYPKWGFTAGVQAEAGISNPEVQASQRYSGYLRLYLPGILKHHSLRTYAGYASQDKLGLSGLPLISLPRGHYTPSSYSYYSGKIDYSFPFAYPDWALSTVVYVKRLKANLFADAMYSEIIEDKYRFKTGIDLSSNFHFLRINVEIDAGVRIIYDPLNSKWDFEFLYSFDI